MTIRKVMVKTAAMIKFIVDDFLENYRSASQGERVFLIAITSLVGFSVLTYIYIGLMIAFKLLM